MDSPYRSELAVALTAISHAARLSQAVLSAADKGVIEKADLSPVTVADFAVQALLAASISAAFPADVLVGEESADELRRSPDLLGRVWDLLVRHVPDDARPESPGQLCDLVDRCALGVPGRAGRTWVFDPIDGTKTFVRGEMYAVNVALLDGGRQVLSAVACPVLDAGASAPVSNASLDPTGRGAVLFAVRGHGAYVRPLFGGGEGGEGEGPARRIERHAEAAGDLRSVTCATMLASGVDGAHSAVAERLGAAFPGCDLLGWVPRWAALALGLGNFTAWVYRTRDYHAKIWDHAGAMLLFEEAGGKVTDVDGRDIDLGAGRKLSANFGFVAAPPARHREVLQAVRDTLLEQGKGHLLSDTSHLSSCER